MKNKLPLLTAAEAEAYVERYAEHCRQDGPEYRPSPEELLDVECAALGFYKVGGWYLDDHGGSSFAASLHKPLGDGSDDLLFGSLGAALEYAKANPL